MDTTDLDKIEARLNAATPGPWWTDGSGEDERMPLIGGDNREIAEFPYYAPHRNEANEDLIAHAPDDLRALVAEVRRLTAWGRSVSEALDGGDAPLIDVPRGVSALGITTNMTTSTKSGRRSGGGKACSARS